MPRTAPGFRTDPSARLAELERQRPEWEAWISLLGEVERSADDIEWESAVASRESRAASSLDAPLLHGCTLNVDAARVQRLIRRLVSIASEGKLEGGLSLRQYRPSSQETLALIGAVLRQDSAEISSVAAERRLDPGALASVIQLAALPLLRSLGRMLEHRIPRHWPHGYCPVCATWPILAERRGLDRSRRLRCGRCAADWEVQWLHCIYCGEKDHERLRSLEPDGRGEMLKVETCASCQGYLKSIASLQGFSPFELMLQDVETVELDLAALDRGYCRPLENGFKLEVQVV